MDDPVVKRTTWSVVGKVSLIAATAIIFTIWLRFTPPGLLGKADAVGYAVCHRIDSRSFFLGDRQIPMCARCSGMFIGILVGLAFQARLGKRSLLPPLKISIPMSTFLITFGVDGLNSYLQFFPSMPALYQPSNWLRLATGTGLGILVAVILLPVFHQAMWREPEERPALERWSQAGALLGIAALVGLAMYSQNPLVLYPLAVLSALTVLLVLTLCYALLWTVVFRRENTFSSWKCVWVPLLGGFVTALVQVGLIDFIRYSLTGTWAGFPL
jgi:uncharacterized membrane protein